MSNSNELHRRKLLGTVVSDKMQKTVKVSVDRMFSDPRYGKQVVRTKKYLAHNPNDEAKVGDRVELTEVRPLSRHKRWSVSAILFKANPLILKMESKEGDL